MSRRRVAIALVVVLAALAGCQRSNPIGVVTPLVPSSSSSSASATPTPTTTPTPTKQELVAEAEGRFREYLALRLRIETAGGATALDPEIDGYVAEPYRGLLVEVLSKIKQSGGHVENSDRTMVRSVAPFDERGLQEAVVAIRVCIDGSGSSVVTAHGTRTPGAIISSEMWFKRDDVGKLRIFYSVDSRVQSC